MAGVVKTVFCIRSWDFSALQDTGGSNSEEYCILKDFPVDGFREGTLLVRVHEADIVNPSSKIEVRAVQTAPSAEDPDVDFDGAELASAEVTGGTVPVLVSDGFSAPFGGFVTIFVKGTQGSNGTNITATLSADLVLKE